METVGPVVLRTDEGDKIAGETEITTAGYANIDIGASVAAWAYLEFQQTDGTKIIRIAKNDSRVTQSTLDTKHVVYTVALTGNDADISTQLPATFGKCAFKNTDSDGADELATDAFTEAVLSTTGDTLTLTVSAGVIT